MKGNRKVVIALIVVILSLSGCKNNQTLVDETLPTESEEEKEDVLDLKSADETTDIVEEVAQQKEEDDVMTEKEEKTALTYKGDILLVEDNVAQVLKDFLSIADEEGKCVSLVVFSKKKNPEYVTICQNPDHVYCIEMDIAGDQIDAMRMEFMR